MWLNIITIHVLIYMVYTDQTCTSSTSDTCIIEISSSWTKQAGNIVCDDRFSNCIIYCNHSDYSCSSAQSTESQNIHIKCPDQGTKCIIHCHSKSACESTQILTSNTVNTEIIINGKDAGKEMIINASSHTDSILTVNVSSDFYDSTVYSHSHSAVIDINCDNANVCMRNEIYAQNIDKSVTYSCNGPTVDCSNTNIYCPRNKNALCNLYCATLLCQNMNVYSSNGVSNIDWECNNKYQISCFDAVLHCGMDQKHGSVNVIYDYDHSEWVFEDFCPLTPPQTNESSEVVQISHLYSDLVDSDTHNPSMFDKGQFLEYVCILLALVLMFCAVLTMFLYCLRKRQKSEISRHQRTIMERMRREQLYNEELANILKGSHSLSDSDSDNDNERLEEREQRLKQFIDKAFDEYESELHFITPTPSLIPKKAKETMPFSMPMLMNDDEIVTKGEVREILENEHDIVTPGELQSRNSMSLLSMISEDTVSMI